MTVVEVNGVPCKYVPFQHVSTLRLVLDFVSHEIVLISLSSLYRAQSVTDESRCATISPQGSDANLHKSTD